MNYTQEGLIITDRDGIISQLNASAERIIGTVNEEACGQNADQLLANRHIVDPLTNESGLADPAHPVVLQRNTIQLDGKSVGLLLLPHSRHGGYAGPPRPNTSLRRRAVSPLGPFQYYWQIGGYFSGSGKWRAAFLSTTARF